MEKNDGMNFNIDLRTTETIKCSCGGKLFTQQFVLKRLPKSIKNLYRVV